MEGEVVGRTEDGRRAGRLKCGRRWTRTSANFKSQERRGHREPKAKMKDDGRHHGGADMRV
jgi:hypothetical protein